MIQRAADGGAAVALPQRGRGHRADGADHHQAGMSTQKVDHARNLRRAARPDKPSGPSGEYARLPPAIGPGHGSSLYAHHPMAPLLWRASASRSVAKAVDALSAWRHPRRRAAEARC
jgi:hypothetical protein